MGHFIKRHHDGVIASSDTIIKRPAWNGTKNQEHKVCSSLSPSPLFNGLQILLKKRRVDVLHPRADGGEISALDLAQ